MRVDIFRWLFGIALMILAAYLMLESLGEIGTLGVVLMALGASIFSK